MNMQKITDEIIRQRLGSQPQYGMARGGHVKKGYVDAGPIELGFAKGGTTIGLIKGKVNPDVADDTTITTPSGATINAKKGEFVLSVDDVENMGGAEKVEMMVKMMRKMHGQPMDMGPKEHDEPDNYGRMDKEGLADGGWTPPYETDYGELLKASPISNVVGFGIPAAVQKGLGFVGNVGSAMGADTDPMAMVKGRTQDVASQLGTATRNIARPIAATAQMATGAPVTGIKQVAPVVKPYALPSDYESMKAKFISDQQAIQTERPDTNMSANEMTRIAMPKTPQLGVQLQDSMESQGLVKNTQGQWEQSQALQDSLAANAAKVQGAQNGIYQRQAQEQDNDRINLARQERLSSSDKMLQENMRAQQTASAEMNRPWWAGGTADTANAGARQLGMLQAQGKQIGEFGQQVGALEGQRLANEALPEQRRAGIVNEMKRLGLAEKELGIKEKQFGEEMGLKREDLGLRRESTIGKRERADNAVAVRELANAGAIQKIVADTYATRKAAYEAAGDINATQKAMDDAQAAGAAARGDTVIPAVAGQEAESSFFGKGKPAIAAQPQQIVPKGVKAPSGMTQIGTSGGKPVYQDAKGNRHIGA